MRRRRYAIAILAAIAAPVQAAADGGRAAIEPPAGDGGDRAAARPAGGAPAAPDPQPRQPPSTLRRAAAIGAAIVPGFLVRGAGSYVLDERRTAKRLFGAGTAGLAAGAIGGVAVFTSGGSPRLVWPGIPLALLGGGVYLSTWFADLWVAAGGEQVRGGPRAAPPWSLELSTTLLRDPYRSRALPGATARVELGRLGLGASALLDAGGDARTGDLEARWRLLGAAAGVGPIAEGSRLYVRAAARYHRDDPDDVTLATAELELVLRGELRHLDPLLAGMFLELTAGAGVERATYARGVHDLGSILLGRFAWGAYLGRRGEAMLFYDHRRDHLAGGVYSYRAAGFTGSAGGAAQVAVAGPWAVRGQLEFGYAWLATLAVRYEGGAR